MSFIKTLAAVCGLAVAGNVQAQLFSAYAEGATNPNAWLTDVSDGNFIEFDDPTTNAVADDEQNRRIYYVVEGGTIFDMHLQYRPVSEDGVILSGVNVGLMFNEGGLVIERTKGLAFGDGVLYLSNSGPGRNGADRGLYVVDPATGSAAFLFAPKFRGQSIDFTGLGFNDADGLLYGVAQLTDGYWLLSIDPDSRIIAEVVPLSDAPGDFESFDGVAIGGNRVYLTFGPSAVDIQVYNLSTGLFDDPLPNPPRGENGSGGATFLSFLGRNDLELAVEGTCPGEVTVNVDGVTPGARVAFLFARVLGSFKIPAGRPCAGTSVDAGKRRARVIATATGDDSGSAQFMLTAPLAACGGFVQAIDTETCSTSNVAELL